MRSIDELVPDVAIAAAGAPKIVIVQALTRALSQFLYKSEAWKEWSYDADPADITNGEFTWLSYTDPDDLDPDAPDQLLYYRVKRVQMIRFGSSTIYPAMPSDIARRDGDWKTVTGVPRSFVSLSEEGGGVRFYPIQSTALPDSMSARLVMITEATMGLNGAVGMQSYVPSIPERIFREYREVIVNGALAILYMIPGRDWTQFSLGQQKGMEFKDATMLAASKAARDENNNQVITTFNPDW